MRSWATANPTVARAVKAVDDERIKVAEKLLLRCGLPPNFAVPRARLLYWAAIGRLMMPFPDDNRLSQSEITDLSELMTRPSDGTET